MKITINQAIKEGRFYGTLEDGSRVYEMPALPGCSMRGGYITPNEPYTVTFTGKEYSDCLMEKMENSLETGVGNRPDLCDNHKPAWSL
jgi:hypothetical protein